MPDKIINDTRLLRLIDKEGKTQAESAVELGVSRQAVNNRLKQLRGRTTHAVIADRIDKVIDGKIDAFQQLEKINRRANELLDQAETDTQEKIKLMSEIRNQLKLQIELFQTLYSMQAAAEFQDVVLNVIGKIDPEIRSQIVTELNSRSAIRNAVTFR
jgi:predicted transcriptional regulator